MTASCAVMAGTVAAYVTPTAWHRPVAALVVVVLVAVNLAGVARTAAAAHSPQGRPRGQAEGSQLACAKPKGAPPPPG